LDDLADDDLQPVDFEHACDLAEQAVDETEVTGGDAGHGGDRFGVGEVGR
jgi:hypothetical protein